MKKYSLTILSEHFDKLITCLLPGDGNEHAAYFLCNISNIEKDPWSLYSHEKFLVTSIELIPSDDIIESTPSRIAWKTSSFVRMLKKSKDNQQLLAIAHSHPAGHYQFSRQDDVNEAELLEGARNRNGRGARLISLIITKDRQLRARIWCPDHSKPTDFEMIRIIGDRFEFHYPGKDKLGTNAFLNRQALAFGEALNRDLGKLKIAVVGCGGTGSATAMLLARLGIGNIILIDDDDVEETNLNRLHGATLKDIGKPKVKVVANMIKNMGLGTNVKFKRTYINTEACRDLLKSCDVIFGCTDDHYGRAHLNRFAYYYLTPVIDMGLAIEVNNEEPPKISTLNGRLTVLSPNNACLICRGNISPRMISEEGMKREDPKMYEMQKKEAYVIGEGNPNPAVVTFTTELACMAVNELIHRLQGFRSYNSNSKVRLFNLNSKDRLQGVDPEKKCDICGNRDIWGAGDTEIFLGLVR